MPYFQKSLPISNPYVCISTTAVCNIAAIECKLLLCVKVDATYCV